MPDPKTVRCPVCGAERWIPCRSFTIDVRVITIPYHVTRRLVAEGKCEEPAPKEHEEE